MDFGCDFVISAVMLDVLGHSLLAVIEMVLSLYEKNLCKKLRFLLQPLNVKWVGAGFFGVKN